MFEVVFNIPFLILNYFIPSGSLLFLLLEHHLVCAASASRLESLSLHRKSSAVRICAQSTVLLRRLDSLWSGIHLVSLVKLLFVVIAITIFEHSFFCLHSKISARKTNKMNKKIKNRFTLTQLVQAFYCWLRRHRRLFLLQCILRFGWYVFVFWYLMILLLCDLILHFIS